MHPKGCSPTVEQGSDYMNLDVGGGGAEVEVPKEMVPGEMRGEGGVEDSIGPLLKCGGKVKRLNDGSHGPVNELLWFGKFG